MSRTLTNIGLKGGYAAGVDGWADEMDANLLKLSLLVQAGVLSRVAAVPGSPAEGDAHILTSAPNDTNIAVYDNGAWVYFEPMQGWFVYDLSAEVNVQFDGVAWVEFTSGGGGGGSLPVGGTTGQVLTKLSATDGDADWETPTGGGGGGGGSPWWFAPPLAADFTVTAASGTNPILTDDADEGLMVDPNNATGVAKYAYQTLTDPSLNWELVVRLTGVTFNQNYSSFGIALIDSVGGKVLRNNLTNNVGMAATKLNDLGSYNSDYFQTSLINGTSGALWLRFKLVGSTLTWGISGEGKNWVDFVSQSVTDFLANRPDRVGLFIASNAIGTRMTCSHFALTGPGA